MNFPDLILASIKKLNDILVSIPFKSEELHAKGISISIIDTPRAKQNGGIWAKRFIAAVYGGFYGNLSDAYMFIILI